MSPLRCILFGSCLVALAAAQPRPTFNNSVCPSFSELRSDNVAANFTTADLPGFYYELALHDVTQFPLCPHKPQCISSNKTIGTHSDGTRTCACCAFVCGVRVEVVNVDKARVGALRCFDGDTKGILLPAPSRLSISLPLTSLRGRVKQRTV